MVFISMIFKRLVLKYKFLLLVEIMCGILGGAKFGPHIRTWGAGDEEANLVSFMSV